MQFGKERDILPLKVPENSDTNMSVEQLLKEKVLEEHKLREMQKEEEAYQPTDDEGEHCNTGAQDTEIDKLKEQLKIFKNDMASSFMPWILDVPENSEFDSTIKRYQNLPAKWRKCKQFVKMQAR